MEMYIAQVGQYTFRYVFNQPVRDKLFLPHHLTLAY